MTATFAGLGLPADLVAALARQGITEPFPIQELTIADALAGRDIWARPRPARARPSPSASRCSAHRQGRAASRRAASCSSPRASSPPRSPTPSGPLGEVRDRKVRAVYGGVSMDPQVERAPEGRRRRRRHARPPHRPHRARRAVGGPGRGARRRRGRPHGRHGLHAPGAEDPLRHQIRAPDDALLRHPRRRGEAAGRPLHGRPGLARGGRVRADRRRDGPPLPRRAPDGQGEGGGVDRQRLQPHARVRPHQARRRPPRDPARPRGRARRCDPRRPAPGCP